MHRGNNKKKISNKGSLFNSIPTSFELNPLTTKSDQDRVSPYNINIVSSRQVMRVKKK